MGLFSNLFGKSSPKPTGNPPSGHPALPTCTSEMMLLERYGAICMERQQALGSLIGSRNWNVDMGTGILSFGNELTFPLQVIGTYSKGGESWLWGWANSKSGVQPAQLKDAQMLKAHGEKHGISLLKESTFAFTEEEIHMMGMIATGFCNASAYYRADYGAGILLATLHDKRIDAAWKFDHHRTLLIFPQFLSAFEVADHRHALRSYLSAKGYAVTEKDEEIVGVHGPHTVTAQFDAQGRMTNLKG